MAKENIYLLILAAASTEIMDINGLDLTYANNIFWIELLPCSENYPQ
jgi:hypothetical protein